MKKAGAMRARTALIAAVAMSLVPALARAQTATTGPAPRSPAAEVRFDALWGRVDAAHLGAGATVPLGNYVRAGVIAGAGFSTEGPSGRIDLIARFHLDPFRESRWSLYAGGGLSTRFDTGENAHTYALLHAGIDGPAVRGRSLSVEAGLGGGARLGVILRRASTERR